MKTPPADFDIRYSTLEDLSTLQRWFDDEQERLSFPFQGDFETQEALKNWIGFSKFHASLTGMLSDTPCSIGTLFLMPYRKVAHHCAFYLIVDPQQRRKGIGASMLRNLLHLAKTRFRQESVHVEFYEPNLPFQTLLEQFRFSVFARQEHFFKTDSGFRPRVLMEHFFDE